MLVILSDIHANFEALEAVLADIDRHEVSSMVCLGDFVGYGASPNECVERVRPLIEHGLIGNHDAAAIGRLSLGDFNNEAATAARWTEQALTAETRSYLESLPYKARWHDALLVHASPTEPEEWHYVLSPFDAEEELRSFEEQICFIGHSHYPGTFEQNTRGVDYTRVAEIRLRDDHRYIVNVPSVGQPRDGDPRAGYALYDPEKQLVRHVRLEYDVDKAMDRIKAAGLPQFLAERLRWGE